MKFPWPHKKPAPPPPKREPPPHTEREAVGDEKPWLFVGPLGLTHVHALALLTLTRQPAFGLLVDLLRAMKVECEVACLDENRSLEEIRMAQGAHARLHDLHALLVRDLPRLYRERAEVEAESRARGEPGTVNDDEADDGGAASEDRGA